MDKRVLVAGGSGLVGSALLNALWNRPNYDVVGTCYSNAKDGCISMEMEQPQSVRDVINKVRPNDIYIAAYISNVDKCENDNYARKVNVGGVKNILDAAKEINARIIFFSSSYVFDGNKANPYTLWDIPCPIQQYGIQKLIGEQMVLNNDPQNIIVRTVGVFGEEDKRHNFAHQVVDSILQHKKIFISSTQLLNPIHADTLAESIIDIAEDGYAGLLHIAGSEEMTKYEWAKDIAEVAGLDSELIIPVKNYPHIAKRPVNGCLRKTTSIHRSYSEDLDRFCKYAI